MCSFPTNTEGTFITGLVEGGPLSAVEGEEMAVCLVAGLPVGFSVTLVCTTVPQTALPSEF